MSWFVIVLDFTSVGLAQRNFMTRRTYKCLGSGLLTWISFVAAGANKCTTRPPSHPPFFNSSPVRNNHILNWTPVAVLYSTFPPKGKNLAHFPSCQQEDDGGLGQVEHHCRLGRLYPSITTAPALSFPPSLLPRRQHKSKARLDMQSTYLLL